MKNNLVYDLTVIGGGIAGICAALSAARQGLKVALINDRLVPGGNASSEHRVHINGGAIGNNSYYSRESGIADELKQTIFHQNPVYNKKHDYYLSDMALLQIINQQKNLDYYCGTVAYDCICKNNKIETVYAYKATTNEEYAFNSKLFCDASGDGTIAYKSGASFRVGREAKSEFNEQLAPEKADSNVMGSCILFTVEKAEHPVSFKKPSFAYDFVKDDIIKYFDRPETGRRLTDNGKMYNGIWWLEYGGLIDTIKDADKIDFELKKLIFSYWDYIKNSGLYPESANYYISWIAPYASKRESRRFIGDYIINENDIETQKHFDDAVSTGGWSLDIHDVGGVYGNEKTSAFGVTPSMYNIPFSIMYSKDIKNLFLAGRIISGTHIAVGSLRVMQTLGAMAQAVGTAAFLCKKYDKMPRQIRDEHIDELQGLLQMSGQYIIGIKEDCGKASKAKITASSVKAFENLSEEKEITLEKGIIYTFPVEYKTFKSVKIRIKNNTNNKEQLLCNVLDEKLSTNYDRGNNLKSICIDIDENFDDYILVPINISTESKKIFLKISENKNLSTFASIDRITGAVSMNSYGCRIDIDDDTLSFCFKECYEQQKLYRAENVVNGYSRPIGLPNCWISQAKENEWISLDFENEINMNSLHLVFNPQYETDHFNSPIKQLITDYKITILHSDGIFEKEVSDNYLGLNIHNISLEGVSKIKIEPIKNNGSKWFEIFAIKVF